MDEVNALVFEDPAALYWALGFAELFTLAVLYKWRSRRALIATGVPAVLAVAVGIAAWLVTTERERLYTALNGLAEAVCNGDTEGLNEWIDDDYDDGVFNKARILDRAEKARKEYGIRSIDITSLKVTIASNEGTTIVGADIDVARSSLGEGTVPTRWTLRWIRQPAGWRLRWARLDRPGGLPGAPGGR